MTETSPAGGPTKQGAKSVRLALLFVLLALVALAGAVVWAGGIDGVADLLGFGTSEPVAEIPPKPEVPPADPVEEPAEEPEPAEEETETVEPAEDEDVSTGTGTSPQTTGTSPTTTTDISAAQAAMYREQLQSQANLAKLANGQVTNLAIGSATTSATKSSVPVTVTYKDGGTLSGTMVLSKTDGLWFFNSITRAGGSDAPPAKPRTIDSGVVRTITEQQSAASNQDLITRGIIERGFVSARVDGVAMGSGTATVNVTLLGGSLDRKPARFVMISKDDSGTKHWFITRFELK